VDRLVRTILELAKYRLNQTRVPHRVKDLSRDGEHPRASLIGAATTRFDVALVDERLKEPMDGRLGKLGP